MNHIDYEALNVTSVVILISHDHQVAISQCLDVGFIILNTHLESKNVDDVLVILRTMISVTEAEKGLDDFWTNVKLQTSKLLDQLGF